MKRNTFNKRYLNTTQAAEYVGVSYNTFVRRVAKRKAPQPDYSTPNLKGWRPATLDTWLTKLRKSGKPMLAPQGRRKSTEPSNATMQAMARVVFDRVNPPLTDGKRIDIPKNKPEDKTGARNLGDAFTTRTIPSPQISNFLKASYLADYALSSERVMQAVRDAICEALDRRS